MRQRFNIMDETESNLLKNDSQNHRKKSNIHTISPITASILICVICSLFGIVCVIDEILPTPLFITDEESHQDRFIAERAQTDLKSLVDLGVRLTGSYENEMLAVDLLKREITMIQNKAHSNQLIEMDLQTVSGSYSFVAFNAYGNVQNVIVKLHSKNNSHHSLLVNAHFDSAPTSPGGSDDGINCAVMLEILRKISQRADRPEHNVIFLFNGAEETPLQASHGFITKHKWASEVRVVINLEAAGAGGKEILFQAGPKTPWLLRYYSKVPHPNGQAAGEELFQTGLIPSDTDFRIFRDFGGVVGMDFAFARDGYRYHTKFDGFDNIPLGSYQHVGDNALSLVDNLANAPELSDPLHDPPDSAIFYDVFGLFLINYSHTTAIILHCVVSLLSLVIAIKSFYDFGLGTSLRNSTLYVSVMIGITLASWLLSGVIVYIIATFLDLVHFTLSWYSNPWLLFGLYVIPVISCCTGTLLLFNHFFNKNNLSIGGLTQVQLHAIRFIWMTALIIGTCLGLRFIYAIFIPFLFQTISFGIIHLFCLQHSIRKWQIINLVGTIIPTLFLMQQSVQILGVIIPVCGRIGPNRNPELYIGILVALLTISTISYYIPIITLTRQAWILLIAFTTIFLVFFIIVFTPLGFPYSGNSESPAPERLWILHTSRLIRNDTNGVAKVDSGFVIINMDRNAPYTVKKYVKDLKIKSVTEDCDNYLFCALPLVHRSAIPILKDTTWIPATQPILPVPVSLQLNSKTKLSDSMIRYNFTASGPSNIVLYFSPRNGFLLNRTSLAPDVKEHDTIKWNNRPAYVVMYSWGAKNTPLVFSLDFTVPPDLKDHPVLDIVITGRYLNERTYKKTAQYINLLRQFPDWTDIVPSLASIESWVY